MASRSTRFSCAVGTALVVALGAACAPAAFAAESRSPFAQTAEPLPLSQTAFVDLLPFAHEDPTHDLDQVQALTEQRVTEEAARAAAERSNKRLDYDPALIAAIGNQLNGGHAICCPAYACAYGDAILTGQANGHEAYGCGCCTWPGWGGGNSSFRSLGSDAALLREAYDEIAAGRPTVIHVSGPYGEHWICLMGYQNVQDPDNLTLDNFLALDPANGEEHVASYRYALYGDSYQHVSDLR